MAKKRGNNEGSIHRRPTGTWRAQVTLNGRRLSFTADTRHDCQEWLKKTSGQIDGGLTFASTRITLGEFLSGWLSSLKPSKRPRTWTHYEQVSRTYILPNLERIKVKDLRPEHIQSLYDGMLDKGVGVFTVLKVHTVLHSALSHAVRTGVIGRNPASLTILPKEPADEMKILDESQVSQMLVAAQDSRLEVLLHLAVVTGMRQMELLGLKWTDLDWVNQTIKVERQLLRPDGEGVKFGPPKTKFGKRSLALGSTTIAVLRSHYEGQHNERKSTGDNWHEYGLIFPNSLGGPIHPRNLLRDFKKLLRDVGLPVIRFHDLRHTAASLMLNHGIPVIVVSRRLGHAKPSITLDIYGHMIPGMQAEAAEKMDQLVTPVMLHPKNGDLLSLESRVN
jgi:integrase